MPTTKLKIFVSSVQKELEVERVAVAGCVSSDDCLANLCEVILFDKAPLSGKRIVKPYLDCLAVCQIYLLILDCEYGNPPEPLSATHEEYRFACDRKLPILVFIKGGDDRKREDKTRAFLAEIKKDNNTYRRFHDRLDLLPEVKMALRRVLKETFKQDVVQSEEPKLVAESASQFEQQVLDISTEELDISVAKKWLVSIKEISEGQALSKLKCLNLLRQKGLVRLDKKKFHTQATGLLFFGKDPALHFPQCRIFVDAFKGVVADSNPVDQVTLSGPAPLLVQRVLDFVLKNTRHPMRVIGLTRVALDEYPQEAVREAIVNAIAHRNYADSARHILVKLFADRLEVLSPGILMKPLTVQKINRGNYLPCSRNPILGQYLNHLRLMDQRGSGIGRMKNAMLDHGLDAPVYDETEGFFKVTMKGPGDKLDRLQLPKNTTSAIPLSVEKQMNDRQKKILEKAVKDGRVTTGWVVTNLKIVKDTAVRDLNSLCAMALLIKTGKGRGVFYAPKTEK